MVSLFFGGGSVMISFEIPYPEDKTRWTKPFGLNSIYSGKHWSRRQSDAQYWHALVANILRQSGINKNILSKPVKIRFYWNDRLDLDNHCYMGKLIVDALKDYLIKDDSRKYLVFISHQWTDEDSIKVEIEEVSNG